MSAVADPASGAMRVLGGVIRVHVVAIAALGTLTFGWLFTGSYLWLPAATCALDWALLNLLNRVVDIREDRANGIIGTDLVDRYAPAVRAGTMGALFASLVLVNLALPPITVLRVAFHALGFVYNWPLLPGRVRLKQLYVLKNLAAVTGFMLTCFAYPLAAARGQLASGIGAKTILTTGVFFFLFVLSYEVVCDLRDVPGDREAAVSTYPVLHGARRAVRIVDALCAASAGTLVLGFALRLVPWRIAIMAFGPVVEVFLYKRWVERGITSDDCVRLTWLGVALLVAYDLWVAFALPGIGGSSS